ncbi:MAG: restriction endonuclease [Bacteroidetes bacterium]|nr:restriction endonuclease [Bacteroidota bacterium]
MKEVVITKASGERVQFSPAKLQNSLKRAGADEAAIKAIVQKIKGQLFEGITTKEIYHMAFDLLKHKTSVTAAKYKLKHGIMELGPNGFAFERFMAEVLRAKGFDAYIGQIVQGRCVSHEIDIIARKKQWHYMIECKFHNNPGFVCDVKIPLYIHSRFRDVTDAWEKEPDHKGESYQGWVVTNTRFTTDAIQYGTCAGLHLLGWDYPAQGSLRDQIDETGLYPLTCLTTLTAAEKQELMAAGLILAREIPQRQDKLSRIGISPQRLVHIMAESESLCTGGLHR